jgi:hypothetical protein
MADRGSHLGGRRRRTMMRLLPMKTTGSRRGEPMISLLFGVPSLTIALGTMILLLLYLVVGSIGPPRFYQVVLVPAEGTDRSGRVVVKNPNEYTVPSMQLFGMLGVGMGCGCLGIELSRRQGAHRKVNTSLAGVIGCAIALGLAWFLYTRAAFG